MSFKESLIKSLEIEMSSCEGNVVDISKWGIANQPNGTQGSVSISGGEGNSDFITIGTIEVGLDSIYTGLLVYGNTGANDRLRVIDSGSRKTSPELFLQSFEMLGTYQG